MNLAYAATCFCPAAAAGSGKRGIFKIKPFNATRNVSFQNKFSCSATVATDKMTPVSEFEIEKKKHDVLTAIQDTQRGLVATADQRSIIEDALVSLEGYNVGAPIDLVKLDGTWRLQYTSAPDVLILLESSARLPFLQVGQIFQKFECRDQSSGGIIRNVVRWSIPTVFEEQDGATLLVSAKFDVVSARNIYLQFEEISIQNIKISEEVQALIAPAILPRSFFSLQILQFIRAFKAQIPVRNPGNPGRRAVGGLYYLSYLDNNMILGRAVGGGGIFVFTKAQPLDL
ncbi:probable plastid-lipid-associated protein 10, chloroplastic [Ricinus communis]|uniref:Structural molecule, putative n=1 Tax=Ricinus communis TaxID=3988 RepID=B9RMZ6_RICCO|nr:probable plastid-lipid-associated protein 10, chloroplastic [Ricinus communis]EEF47119.1 structural molecule, putative [Ricinus communis]|eukprot:XP_002515135.1 probable plastid-lipid-associated protein 10, chloroplastic [Ricinus communis]